MCARFRAGAPLSLLRAILDQVHAVVRKNRAIFGADDILARDTAASEPRRSESPAQPSNRGQPSSRAVWEIASLSKTISFSKPRPVFLIEARNPGVAEDQRVQFAPAALRMARKLVHMCGGSRQKVVHPRRYPKTFLRMSQHVHRAGR